MKFSTHYHSEIIPQHHILSTHLSQKSLEISTVDNYYRGEFLLEMLLGDYVCNCNIVNNFRGGYFPDSRLQSDLENQNFSVFFPLESTFSTFRIPSNKKPWFKSTYIILATTLRIPSV